MLGRFRFSVTTDDRSTFADGLATGGDVTASWTPLTSPSVTLIPAGMTSAVLGDGSVLIGGTVPDQGSYIVEYAGSFAGITGLRLEVLADPSLPTSGPGIRPGNGNFVLSEIEVNAVPEPAAVLLLGIGLAGLAIGRPR